MGERGRPAKPTHLKLLHGDRRDRINDAEPVPAAIEAEPPEWLSEEAKAIWERLLGRMAKGLVTAVDEHAFAMLCTSLATFADAETLVQDSGLLIIDSRTGALIDNPALKIRERANDQFQRWAARFGLTPSDRSQIRLEVNDAQGGGGDLLTG